MLETCSDGSPANERASEVGSPAGEISPTDAAAHGARTPQSTNYRGLCRLIYLSVVNFVLVSF